MRTLKPLAGLALLLVVGLGIYLYLNRAGRPEVDPALQQASEAFLRERGGGASGGSPSVDGKPPVGGNAPPPLNSNGMPPMNGSAPPMNGNAPPPPVSGNALPQAGGKASPLGAMDMAQMPEPVMGKIERVEDNAVVLSTEEGTSTMIHFVDKTILQALVEIKLSDIQPGDRAMIFGKRDGENFRASQVRLVQGEEGFMGGGMAIDTGEAANQQAPPEPVYGTVEQVSPNSFVIKNRDGNDSMTIQLSGGGKIVRQQDIQIADLRPGDMLMTMCVKDGDTYQVIQAIKGSNTSK